MKAHFILVKMFFNLCGGAHKTTSVLLSSNSEHGFFLVISSTYEVPEESLS